MKTLANLIDLDLNERPQIRTQYTDMSAAEFKHLSAWLRKGDLQHKHIKTKFALHAYRTARGLIMQQRIDTACNAVMMLLCTCWICVTIYVYVFYFL